MRLVAALATYVLASVALFGREVLGDPSDTVVGDAGADKTLYLWALEWWPWALRHGHNPLDVDVAWMPHGYDFGLGTAGGGLALVAAPLTAFAGPVVTYNVLILLAPALAAATAFLLADHLTRAFLPSLVGGWIFGFSSYEFGRIVGHLPLAFVALVPLVPYLALRRHRDELSRRAFVILLALVLVAQFLVVTQTFFTLIVVGGCAALVALVVLGASVRATIVESAVACLVSFVLIAPVIAYAIVSSAAAPARSPFAESADVLNYVVPTRRTWIDVPGSDEIAARFTATGAEQGAYLSVPLLALAILAVLRRPIERPRIALGILLLCVVALSLGTRPKVAGVVVGFGPWAPFARLPFLESALPARLTLYAALLVGLLVSLESARRRGPLVWALVGTGIVLTLPNLQLRLWSSDVPRPTFFGGGWDERHVRDGETVLLLPYGPAGWSMLWQAEEEFRFRLVGGHFALRVTPSEERWRDVYEGLGSGRVDAKRVTQFLARHCVDAVVATPGTRPGTRRGVERAWGEPAARAGDGVVYRPRGRRSRSCRRRSSGSSRTRRRVLSLRSLE